MTDKVGMSRNDLEALTEGSNPFIKTVEIQTLPSIETAKPKTYPFMELAQPDIETDATKMTHQLDSGVLPLIEMVRSEN